MESSQINDLISTSGLMRAGWGDDGAIDQMVWADAAELKAFDPRFKKVATIDFTLRDGRTAIFEFAVEEVHEDWEELASYQVNYGMGGTVDYSQAAFAVHNTVWMLLLEEMGLEENFAIEAQSGYAECLIGSFHMVVAA